MEDEYTEHRREESENEQKRLAQYVGTRTFYFPQKGHIVLGLDVQYEEEQAFIAGDLYAWEGEHLGTYVLKSEVHVPYLPGFFALREGSLLEKFIEILQKTSLPSPQLLVIDGHGTAHPRGFGLACQIGLRFKLPSIGCAKESLLPYEAPDEGQAKSSFFPVFNQGLPVGYALRRNPEAKPIFVSAGHLLNQENARDIVLKLPGSYRVPDLLRNADHIARTFAKDENAFTKNNLLYFL